MRYRLLGHTGLSVSVLGLGASPFGGVFGPVQQDDATRTLRLALDHGVNFIDVAPCYGATVAETRLGVALAGVPRDRYLLASKVGQDAGGRFDFSSDGVRTSLHASLRRLRVDYLDLVQCHDIEFADLNQIIGETLPCLRGLRDAGYIRHVGVTGLSLTALGRVAEQAAPGHCETVLSFCRHTLSDDSLAGWIPRFSNKGLGIINASPTGMGLFTEDGPPDWHPAPPALKHTAREAVAHCRRRGGNIVRCALQFSTSHPGIATTLVGTADPRQMAENIGHITAEPETELIQEIRTLLAPVQRLGFQRGRAENRDPE